jgi:hypothetical protein
MDSSKADMHTRNEGRPVKRTRPRKRPLAHGCRSTYSGLATGVPNKQGKRVIQVEGRPVVMPRLIELREFESRLSNQALRLHALHAYGGATPTNVGVADRSGAGLQTRSVQFDSGRPLHTNVGRWRVSLRLAVPQSFDV